MHLIYSVFNKTVFLISAVVTQLYVVDLIKLNLERK